jgi:hypothetical protein
MPTRQFNLRALLIALAVGPMALAGAWFTAGRVLEPNKTATMAEDRPG